MTLTPTATSIPTEVLDPQRVREVVLDEVNGAITQDINLLEAVYAPNATVIDRRGTPDDSSDDTVWQGWANIKRRYDQFFSANYKTLSLVEISVTVEGQYAEVAHKGAVIDGTWYKDDGLYKLEKIGEEWFITSLEYGLQSFEAPSDPPSTSSPTPPSRDDGLYELAVGNQHRYEEPWGWDRGDPCQAWVTNNFDDTKPNYRGFNIELLLTNHSNEKVPDDWPLGFTTANGQTVQACYYAYQGSGPPPDTTSSVTFFTVVEQGDYVETITLTLQDQVIRLCLDGQGSWDNC